MMRIFIIQVHDPVIHLEVDEEQLLSVSNRGKKVHTNFGINYTDD